MFDLKKFRKDKKLKQSDMAKLFSCNQSNISMLENTMRDLTSDQMEILSSNYGKEEVEKYYKRSVISTNISGSKNTGVFGNNIDLSTSHIPHTEKIINEQGIEITRIAESKEISRLSERIAQLELELLGAKNIIESKEEIIRSKEEVIKAKEEVIDSLKNKK